MNNLLWSAAIMVLMISGCGWNGTPTRNNDFTPLTSITVKTEYSTIAAKTTTKLTVEGNFSGYFKRDITDQVKWEVVPGGTGKVEFNPTVLNRVKGVTAGDVVVRATMRGVTATIPISVSPAIISSIAVTPAVPSVAKGLSQQFTATGTFLDGTISTTQDITFDASWVSTALGVATISDVESSKGLAQTLTAGMSTITATFDNKTSDPNVMTVTEPVLQSIALSLTNPSILTLSTKKITATGNYSDGSTPDITSQVAWSSSNADIATIAADGTMSALTQGTTTISATLGSIAQTTNLKTTGGNLTGIALSPLTNILVNDTVGRLTATGTFNNGSRRDITGAVTWTVADSSLAKVTSAGGNLAWLKPLAVTPTTTVTATSGSLSATTNLKVTSLPLASIAFSTTSLVLTAGTSTPLTVNATFNDGTVQDVTALSTFTPNDSTVATVANSGLAAGHVTGVAATLATTQISATYGGKTVLTPASVTVMPRIIQYLTISGSSSATAGNQASYTALASYFDGTTKDVTQESVWTLNPSNVAILADSVNQAGQVVAVDSGSATLTASFDGKTQTATILVTAP